MNALSILARISIARKTVRVLLATALLSCTPCVEAADSSVTNAGTAAALTEKSQLASPSSSQEGEKKDDRLKDLLGLGIAYLAVTLGIGVALLAIWTDYKKRRDLIQFVHQERMALLEKGLELPPIPSEIFSDVWTAGKEPKPYSPVRGLKAGLVWLVIGIGQAVYLWRAEEARMHPSIAIIPLGIGIVYLICYLVERRAFQPQQKPLN